MKERKTMVATVKYFHSYIKLLIKRNRKRLISCLYSLLQMKMKYQETARKHSAISSPIKEGKRNSNSNNS